MKKTKRWNLLAQNKKNQRKIMEQAIQLLKAGELVAFPTETVYGLGADATNEAAVAKIFKAKGRPQDNPLIVHVANKRQILPLVTKLPSVAKQLIDRFSPGPITYILPHSGVCATRVTAGLPTIAVRIPKHPIALKLLSLGEIPLAAPSANLSGKPSPTTADHVNDDLKGKIAAIIDGGQTQFGMESTVIDLTKSQPMILRPGAVTQEMIEQALNMPIAVVSENKPSEQPLSPGLKYPHYAPEVPLVLGPYNRDQFEQLIAQYKAKGKRIGVLAREQMLEGLTVDQKVSLGRTLEDVGQYLYESLRTFKRGEVDIIICESFPKEGLGRAIMNRLYKAATAVR